MSKNGAELPPKGRQRERELALTVLTELAGGGLAERMRLEAAARILVAARRAAALAPLASQGEADAMVVGLAREWDPASVTALEYVEALPPAAVDRLLSAAPRWAARAKEQVASAGHRLAA